MAVRRRKYRRIDSELASPSFAHPQYRDHLLVWETQRDAVVGEDAIKDKGECYLPKMSAQDDSEYCDYLDRAVYVNMTGRTKSGLVGSIFRRAPAVNGLDPSLTDAIESITDDGLSLTHFAKVITDQILEVGRYGVLLDQDPDGTDRPYLSGYRAENILDWSVDKIAGKRVLTRVILREGLQATDDPLDFDNSAKVRTAYRVLYLEFDESRNRYVYRQAVFRKDSADASLSDVPEIITPMNMGRTFDRIPFQFFGPFYGTPDVEKPPLRDITVLNLAHYRQYAQLEHGRWYTALPVYYAPTASEGNEYVIGPSVVWEIGAADEKPGILEFSGHGLTSLERGLTEKAAQISAIGGRLIGGGRTPSESDNQAKMKEANERSMLLNAVEVIDSNLTWILRYWEMWALRNSKIRTETHIRLNTDFLLLETGARELRAIHSMYTDGLISVQVLYDYLLKAEVIPETISLPEFTEYISDPDNFPNQPDALARSKGYADAEAMREAEEAARAREAEEAARQAGTPTGNEGPEDET